MKIKKIIILSFCAIFLGAQLMVIIVPYGVLLGKNWKIEDRLFWPFKRYPMYSSSKNIGDKLEIKKILVVLENNKKITINYRKLHIFPYRLSKLLYSAKKINDSIYTPTYKDYQNLNYLDFLIRKYISPNSKRLELWTKTFVISSKGIKNFDVNWKLTNSWVIKDNISKINISFY